MFGPQDFSMRNVIKVAIVASCGIGALAAVFLVWLMLGPDMGTTIRIAHLGMTNNAAGERLGIFSVTNGCRTSVSFIHGVESKTDGTWPSSTNYWAIDGGQTPKVIFEESIRLITIARPTNNLPWRTIFYCYRAPPERESWLRSALNGIGFRLGPGGVVFYTHGPEVRECHCR